MTNSKSTKIWAITAEYTSGIMGGMSVWEIYRYLFIPQTHISYFVLSLLHGLGAYWFYKLAKEWNALSNMWRAY